MNQKNEIDNLGAHLLHDRMRRERREDVMNGIVDAICYVAIAVAVGSTIILVIKNVIQFIKWLS